MYLVQARYLVCVHLHVVLHGVNVPEPAPGLAGAGALQNDTVLYGIYHRGHHRFLVILFHVGHQGLPRIILGSDKCVRGRHLFLVIERFTAFRYL